MVAGQKCIESNGLRYVYTMDTQYEQGGLGRVGNDGSGRVLAYTPALET